MKSDSSSRRDYLRASAGVLATCGISGCLGMLEESSGYPSNEIEWIIPFSQGGGFDQASRALAEFMPKHLPNDVNIRPKNVTAAAGLKAATTIHQAKPTGYTVGMLAHIQTLLHQFNNDVPWKTGEFSYFGAPSTSIYTTVTGTDTPYETIEDLRGADQIKVGVLRPSGSLAISFNALAEKLDISYEFVSGYGGTDELYTAIARGDVDIAQGAAISANDAIEGELGINPLVVFRREVPSILADTDVASLSDIGSEELEAIGGETRGCCGPPNMDESRRKVLEEALTETVNSDEMKEWADSSGNILNPLTPDEITEQIKNANELLPKYRI